MSDDILRSSHEDGVLNLVLDRPAKRNALSADLRNRLVGELDAAADDDSIGAVVISGAGGHFCAGFDLTELAEATDPAMIFADAAHYHHRVHTFAKPVIAAVAGACVAGGLDLALMCDLRIAGHDAILGQPQVRHGVPASYELLAGVVGDAAARELCLTGRTIDAEEAVRLGLVHRAIEPKHLLATTLELATDIASLPASAATKALFVANQADPFSDP